MLKIQQPYKMPFKARSRVKNDEKLKITKIHEIAKESELPNLTILVSLFWGENA